MPFLSFIGIRSVEIIQLCYSTVLRDYESQLYFCDVQRMAIACSKPSVHANYCECPNLQSNSLQLQLRKRNETARMRRASDFGIRVHLRANDSHSLHRASSVM